MQNLTKTQKKLPDKAAVMRNFIAGQGGLRYISSAMGFGLSYLHRLEEDPI